MRLVITAGGTAGHVVPAIALADKAVESGFASQVTFIGGEGMEGKLVPAAGFVFKAIPTGRVRGMSLATRLRGVGALGAGVPRAVKLLKEAGAQAVVGMGGFASAATVTAAALAGIPVVLCEQNTIPGSANRLLARVARRICLSYAMSSAYLPSWKSVVTGNPVRSEVVRAAAGRRVRGEGPGLRILLLGGSQGALFLNQTVAPALRLFLEGTAEVTLLHQAGAGREAEAWKHYGGLEDRVRVAGYIDDVAAELAAADLVIARAGATTLAELAVVGGPSVLIPFPFATDDHQRWNAKAMERSGAAVVMEQHSFDSNRFLSWLGRFQREPELGRTMGACALAAARPDAAQRVLRVVEEVVA